MSERLFVGEVERKLKRMMEEPPTLDPSESGLLLSLTLGQNNKTIIGGSSSSSFTTPLQIFKNNENNSNSPIDDEERKFPCRFCNKKFASSQALGGHQNAHRRERVMSRMEREYQMGTFGVSNANGINIGGHNHNMYPSTFAAHHHQYPLSGPSFCHAYGTPHMHHHHPISNVATPHHHHTMSWPHFTSGYGINPYGMMNNTWGTPQTPQVPNSLAGGDDAAVNRNPMTQAAIDASMGNHYVGNQKMPSSFPDLSLNL